MKKVTLFVLLGFCWLSVYAQDANFRNQEWGVNKSDVKSAETAKLVLDDARLLKYQTTLAGYNTTVSYMFSIDNQLMNGRYTLKNPITSPKGYFSEFTFFENLLSEKYGDKEKTLVKVKNNPPAKEENYLLYLKAGELTKETLWSTPDTDITLTLSTFDNVVGIQILYSSKKFNGLNKQKKQQLLLKDL